MINDEEAIVEEEEDAGESVMREIKESVLRGFNRGIVYEHFNLEQLA